MLPRRLTRLQLLHDGQGPAQVLAQREVATSHDEMLTLSGVAR